jgi:HlyD family secretion protein
MKKKFFSKRKIIIFIVAVVVILTGWGVLASRNTSKITYVTDKAVKKDLLQTVSEVGTVNSPNEIELNFSAPGTLQDKLVKIGDKVKAGQVLADLDSRTFLIQRDQVAANLASARASLEKLQHGATAQEIAVLSAQAAQANAAYLSAQDNLDKTKNTVAETIRQAAKNSNDLIDSGPNTPTTFEQAVISAQTVLDNTKTNYQKAMDNSTQNLLNDLSAKLSVANTALDDINKMITDNNIKDYLSSKNKSYLSNTNITYNQASTLFDVANSSLSAAESDESQAKIIKASDDFSVCLKKVSESLDDLYGALENSSFSQSISDVYKADINTQITYISAAINVMAADRQAFDSASLSYNTNVSSAQNSLDQAQAALTNAVLAANNTLSSAKTNGDQQITVAQNSVTTAQQASEVVKKQLAELKAPARPEDVSLAEAKIVDAQSSLDLANKQIDDAQLKSPIDGQIVKDNYEVGEQVSAAKSVFSVLAENSFEIDVDISESDIAKVKNGDQVDITLDAFGPDQKFQGQVFFIEPASTVIQDVIYYKVKIAFTDSEEKLAAVKPGMTANVTIITDKREKVLAVPERAVIRNADGGKIVRVLQVQAEKITETPVETGLRGDDGSIEITGGNLKEGATIVVQIKTK